MKLSRQEVEHIARLARLTLTEAEIVRYQEQLSDILDYAAMLQSVDTSGIAPVTSVLPPKASALRADQPGDTTPLSQLFNNAPDQQDDQFKVPPVMEQDA
jgi:aspartyl-tRNA(Asn)/glutamyl-tRNA(Gln) amidotransferase subunit C